jgi:hypothetical protein
VPPFQGLAIGLEGHFSKRLEETKVIRHQGGDRRTQLPMSLGEEMSEETSEEKPGGIPLAILAVAVVLLNVFAGGCVIHQLGPIEAASALFATPSFTLDFLLGGLGFYLLAIGLVGLVALPMRLVSKKRLGGEAFLVWTTAVNFFLVALAAIGGG